MRNRSKVDTEYLAEAANMAAEKAIRNREIVAKRLSRFLDGKDGVGFAKWVQLCPPSARTHWAVILAGYRGMDSGTMVEYFNRALAWLEKRQAGK